MRVSVFLLSALLAGALVDGPVAMASQPKAVVSFLDGTARVERAGKETRLGLKTTVAPGDRIRTGKSTRLELKLEDGSVVRVGAESEVLFDELALRRGKRERASFTLVLGRVWAKVVKAVGGQGSFEVHTANAVSGVRGTSFTVLAARDSSAIVRVYSGTVGVRRKPTQSAHRVEVPGPQEIDKRQWEEIVAEAMKQVRISSLGEISPAEDFEDQGPDLDWSSWNRSRDEAAR